MIEIKKGRYDQIVKALNAKLGIIFVGSRESCEAFKQGSDNIRTVL